MYAYKTKGVCAREVHFELAGNRIQWVRFLGGGCPGNAEAVGKLAAGKDVRELIGLMKGISCRNETSCADQLALALREALEGRLPPSSISVIQDPSSFSRVAVIAEINGDAPALGRFLRWSANAHLDAVFCLGNQIGDGPNNDEVIHKIHQQGWRCILGPRDHRVLFGRTCREDLPESDSMSVAPSSRAILEELPHLRLCRIGNRDVLLFYDGYVQDLHGFSEFAPFSTELLMVSNLSDYLRDETVFPALEAMTSQFGVRMVLFGHTGVNKHVRLGGVDFINVGSLSDEGNGWVTLLENRGDGVAVSFVRLDS